MKRYEQKISEVGLTKGTISTKIKNMIREFKEAEDEVAELESNLESETDEAKKAEIKEKIAEYKQTLDDAEVEIIQRIEDFASKKHIYDENIKRMIDAKKAKSAARAEGGITPAAEPEKAPEGAPQPQEAPVAAPVAAPPPASAAPAKSEPITVVAEEVKEEKKSKGGGGWIFAGILTVAAILIGVNVMKNKD